MGDMLLLFGWDEMMCVGRDMIYSQNAQLLAI